MLIQCTSYYTVYLNLCSRFRVINKHTNNIYNVGFIPVKKYSLFALSDKKYKIELKKKVPTINNLCKTDNIL